MVLKHYYDIGVAIGAAEGLVVPVLRRRRPRLVRRDRTPDQGISQEGRGAHAHARGPARWDVHHHERRCLRLPDEHPILNPPQVGILGLHKIADRALPVDGKVEIRPMMYVALSYDHRIVDGLEAVRFLSLVKEFVEDPSALLFES